MVGYAAVYTPSHPIDELQFSQVVPDITTYKQLQPTQQNTEFIVLQCNA